MSIGTLSNLGKLQTLINETDLNLARFSALAALYDIQGLSETNLSRALGGKPLRHDVDKSLGVLVRRLESFIHHVAPLAVSFRDAERVKSVMDALESGSLAFIVLSGKDIDSGGF